MLNLFRTGRSRRAVRPQLSVEALGERAAASSLSVASPMVAPATTAMLSPSVSSIQVSPISMPSPRCITGQPIALTGPSMAGAAFLQITNMVCIPDGTAVFSGTVTRVTAFGLENTAVAGWLGAPRFGGSRISTCNIHFSGVGTTQIAPGQFAMHQMQYDGTLDLGWHSAWTGGAFSDLAPGYGGIPPTWASGTAIY